MESGMERVEWRVRERERVMRDVREPYQLVVSYRCPNQGWEQI